VFRWVACRIPRPVLGEMQQHPCGWSCARPLDRAACGELVADVTAAERRALAEATTRIGALGRRDRLAGAIAGGGLGAAPAADSWTINRCYDHEAAKQQAMAVRVGWI